MPITPKCGNCAPVIELCPISVRAERVHTGGGLGGGLSQSQCQLVIQVPFCIEGFTCGDPPLTPLNLSVGGHPGGGFVPAPDGSITLFPAGGNKPSFSLGVPVRGASHAGGSTADSQQANKFTDKVCCKGLIKGTGGGRRHGQPWCTPCCDFLFEALKRRLANQGGLYLGNKSCDDLMPNLSDDEFTNIMPAGGNVADYKICHSCTITIPVHCNELTGQPQAFYPPIVPDLVEWYVDTHLQEIAHKILSELKGCIQGIFSTPGLNTWDRKNGTLRIPQVKLDPTQQEYNDYNYWLDCRAACKTNPPGSMCCPPR